MEAQTLFIVLFLVGILLIGAELFVPGGILGALGGLMLLGAIGAAFFISPTFGLAAAGAAAVLSVVSIALWITLFPKTGLGRKMTLAQDSRAFKSSEEGLESLLQKEGVASSDLRPGGFATIDGRRVNVVSEGGMISRDTRVRVTMIEGNRVVVRAISANEDDKGKD